MLSSRNHWRACSASLGMELLHGTSAFTNAQTLPVLSFSSMSESPRHLNGTERKRKNGGGEGDKRRKGTDLIVASGGTTSQMQAKEGRNRQPSSQSRDPTPDKLMSHFQKNLGILEYRKPFLEQTTGNETPPPTRKSGSTSC